MSDGEWYTCLSDELERLLNATDAFIDARFHYAYGFNIPRFGYVSDTPNESLVN